MVWRIQWEVRVYLALLIPAGSSSFLFGLCKIHRSGHNALSSPERITVQSLSQGENLAFNLEEGNSHTVKTVRKPGFKGSLLPRHNDCHHDYMC